MPSAIDNQPVGAKLWSWMQGARPAQSVTAGLPTMSPASVRTADEAAGNAWAAEQIPMQVQDVNLWNRRRAVQSDPAAGFAPGEIATLPGSYAAPRAAPLFGGAALPTFALAPSAPTAAPARTVPAQEELPMPVVKYGIPEDAQAGQSDLAERLAKSGVSLGSLIKLMGVLPQAQKPVRNPFADDAGRLAAAAARSAYDEVWSDPKASVDAKRKARASYLNTMTSLARGNPQAAAVADLIGQ